MTTYVNLLHFTPEAVEDVHEGPRTLEDLKGMFGSLHGELKGFYLTMGEYDGIVISEFANRTAAARAALLIGQTLRARTETLQAFTEEEYGAIVDDLS